jgi:hypothetical protein
MHCEHTVRAITVDEVNPPMMAKKPLMDWSTNFLRPQRRFHFVLLHPSPHLFQDDFFWGAR